MPRNVSFGVRPRYTPGSPCGTIPEELALRIASEEKENYEVALSGVYGDSIKAVAQTQGLEGIVERKEERGNGWDVTDLITGRRFRRETIKAKNILPGDTITKIEMGPEYGRWDDHLPVKAVSVAHVTKPSHTIVRWEPMVGLHFIFDNHDTIGIERDIKEES